MRSNYPCHLFYRLLCLILCAVFLMNCAVLTASSQATGHIAFISERDHQTNISIVSPDGSHLRRLDVQPDENGSLVWSPDGQRLAFRVLQGNNGDVYVINQDGSHLARLTSHPFSDGYTLSWSPNGQYLAFESYRDSDEEIYTIKTDGTELKRLTVHPGRDNDPIWSRDGQFIVFSSENGGAGLTGIAIVGVDGTHYRRLSSATTVDFSPTLSPNGELIGFVSQRDGNNEIYRMNIDGTNVQRLTHTAESEVSPRWSPDGQYSKSTMVVKSCQKVYISHMSKPAMDKRNRYADT
jgi:Tol biopolymer transport system component